jgi:uncharacterized protein DUF4124
VKSRRIFDALGVGRRPRPGARRARSTARRAAVSAILLASFAIAPVGADAFGGSRGGFNSGGGFQGFNPNGGFQGFNPNGGFQGFNPQGGFQGFNPGQGTGSFNPPSAPKPGRFPPRERFRRSFATGGYLIGGYGVPFYYDATSGDSASDSSAYVYDYSPYAPPAVYIAPPSYAPPAAPFSVSVGPSAPPGPGAIDSGAPSRPGVVEYPEGRYELRGDGARTPYIWVWIPNPPAAPPAPPPPPPAAAPGVADRRPVRRDQLYRWVDEQGVMHLTDNAEAVPEEFRKPGKRNNAL